MSKCFFCQNELDLKHTPGRSEECTFCGRELHCCVQCAFYDETCHNQCREPGSPRITIKDRSNFCDWFQFGRQDVERQERKSDIKSKLDELFKK